VTASERGFGPLPSTDSEQASLTSVVLCTTGQTRNLARAIRAVLAQTWSALELVVVDNRPGSGNALDVVAGFDDARVRYVAEPVHGLSTARNTGVRHARGGIIAFTDDDCVPDSDWITTLRGTFDCYPRISCVTGKTVAFGEMTLWESLFEEFGSFDRGDETVIWRKTRSAATSGTAVGHTAVGHAAAATESVQQPVSESTSESTGKTTAPEEQLPAADGSHSSIYPYTGVFGSGNNMAFRAEILAQAGYFDEALGAGTPSGGGEDLDMFIRLVQADRILAFEPAALVRHQHRGSGKALRTQIRNYGSGLSAMMTKQLLSDRTSWKLILRRLGPGLSHLVRPTSVKNSRKSPSYPVQLTVTEWYGVALGPWLYLRGRWAVRRRQRVGGTTSAPTTGVG
jgi:GT2 family glycosyltransferase